MKIKWLMLAGVEVDEKTLNDLGEAESLDPPDPDNPYWEIKFKNHSIFATDRASVCIENSPESKEDGERKIKTVTQMKG